MISIRAPKSTGVLLRCAAVAALLAAVLAIPAHGGGPATSASWIITDHEIVGGREVQVSPSYTVNACIATSIAGVHSSASYRVEAGCARSASGIVPVELQTFVVE